MDNPLKFVTGPKEFPPPPSYGVKPAEQVSSAAAGKGSGVIDNFQTPTGRGIVEVKESITKHALQRDQTPLIEEVFTSPKPSELPSKGPSKAVLLELAMGGKNS